jgi:hypothetical protein
MAEDKDKKAGEFEIVSAESVQFVRRGRKANADPELVKALAKLTKGNALVLRGMAQDPKAETYATDKSRISSQIRTACKAAGLAGFRILWTPTGVPQVVV